MQPQGVWEYRDQACKTGNDCSAFTSHVASINVLPLPAPNKPYIESIEAVAGDLKINNPFEINWSTPDFTDYYMWRLRPMLGDNELASNQVARSIDEQSDESEFTVYEEGKYKFRIKACNRNNVCSAWRVHEFEVRSENLFPHGDFDSAHLSKDKYFDVEINGHDTGWHQQHSTSSILYDYNGDIDVGFDSISAKGWGESIKITSHTNEACLNQTGDSGDLSSSCSRVEISTGTDRYAKNYPFTDGSFDRFESGKNTVVAYTFMIDEFFPPEDKDKCLGGLRCFTHLSQFHNKEAAPLQAVHVSYDDNDNIILSLRSKNRNDSTKTDIHNPIGYQLIVGVPYQIKLETYWHENNGYSILKIRRAGLSSSYYSLVNQNGVTKFYNKNVYSNNFDTMFKLGLYFNKSLYMGSRESIDEQWDQVHPISVIYDDVYLVESEVDLPAQYK